MCFSLYEKEYSATSFAGLKGDLTDRTHRPFFHTEAECIQLKLSRASTIASPFHHKMLLRLSGSKVVALSTGSYRGRRSAVRRYTSSDSPPNGAQSETQSTETAKPKTPFQISFPDNPFSAPPPNASYSPNEPAYQLRSPFDSSPFTPVFEQPSPTPTQNNQPQQPVESSPTAPGPAPVRSDFVSTIFPWRHNICKFCRINHYTTKNATDIILICLHAI